MKTKIFFTVMALAALPALAVRPKIVYLVQHTHSDIGYARPQAGILAHYVEQIDHALDYCDLTKDYPKDAQFHWTCEVAATTLNFIRTRPPEQIARLRHWVQQGNIEVAGMLLNSGEICDDAEVFHSFRELRELREAGFPITMCMQNDVNGLAWSVADYASDLGIKYTWMGENTGRAMKPFANPTVYRWQSPSGREMLAFRSEHYMTGNFWGLPNCDEERFAKRMNDLLDRLEKADYPFDAIGIPYMGFPTDDSPPNWQPCDFVRRWNEGKHDVRLVCATASMFMDHVARDTAAVAKLAVHRAAYPDWWTDGFGTCAAETGEALLAQRKLVAAEGALAMAMLKGRAVPAAVTPLIANMRTDLCYWGEHTVGSHTAIKDHLHWRTIEDWRGKQSFVWSARRNANLVFDTAAGLLQPDFARDPDHATLTLVNSLPWTRDGFAEVFIDFNIIPSGSNFRFVDEKGEALMAHRLGYTPFEAGRGCPDGMLYRIFARNLPPCGYRTYRIEVGGPYRENRDAATLENEFYRIAVDAEKGVVTSIFDKRAKRELVDPAAPHRLGEIIYETFGDRSLINNLYQYNPKKAAFQRKGCTNFKAAGGSRNPLYDSVKFTADFPEEGATGFSVEVRLMHGRPAIELAYRLRRAQSGNLSGFYVAFPFTGKKLAFDVPGGLVHPGENQLEGTSTAWNSVQNFAAAEDGDFRILLSSPVIPLVQFGKIFGDYPIEYLKKYDHPYIYSWPMNNYWWTNFVREQNGDFAWSYQITTQQGKGEEGAFRWTLAEQVPLLSRVQMRAAARGLAALPGGSRLVLRSLGEGGSVATANSGNSTPREWRGLELANPALVSTALMPALDGKGLVMVVGERSGKATTMSLKGPDGQPVRFRRIDATERPLGDFTTEMPVKAYENLSVYIDVGGTREAVATERDPPKKTTPGGSRSVATALVPQTSQTFQTFQTFQTSQTSQIFQTSPYRFFRFKVEEIKGDSNGTQISELELFENGKNLRGEVVRAFADEKVLDAEGRKYRDIQAPEKALDGVLISKWFDYRGDVKNPPEVRDAVWMAVELKRPVKLSGYAWISAEDYVLRDPASWRLQGSNDGKTWTDIHVVRGFRASDGRNVRAYEMKF